MHLRTALGIILLLGLIGFIGFKLSEIYKKTPLESPVLGISTESISENIWFPKITDEGINYPDAPEITSNAAFFIETSTGQVLFSKNINQRFSIASLAKIMTTIVTLEHKKMDDIFTVSKKASEIEPDKMFLQPNEKLTLKELLEGIFLVSANDAAEVMSELTTATDRESTTDEGRRKARTKFISLMNLKANQIGLINTFFLNPTGLEEDYIKQYSSAFDVAVMSRYLIKKWPEIVDIASQPYVYIDKTSYHQDYEMYTGINLLTTYPGVVGLKTGFTPEAGLTLVTLARKGNSEVLGVLLGAVNRRDDAKLMLDYSFKKLGFEI